MQTAVLPQPQHRAAVQHRRGPLHLLRRRRVACQWRKTNWKKQKKTSQSPLTSVGQMEGMADGMAPSSATQLAKARAPFRACQAKQQRSRTQSCTGSLFCLPGEAATQQNAVLHGRLFALARGGSNTATQQQRSLARASFCACQARQQSRTQSCTGAFLRLPGTAATHLASTTVIQHDGHPARRSSSTTVRYGANPGRLGGTPCWGIVHWDSNPSVSVFVWVSVFGYRLMYRLM